MNKNEVKDIEIEKFINSKDKNMKFNNFKDLLKEGSIFNFYFIYKSDEDENKYVSKNIVKLDLYRKQVTTTNRKVFHFINEIG